MKTLLFATGNAVKFRTASLMCQKFGIQLKQASVNIPEIQAHVGETVARDKAERTYEELRKPVIISDDSWLIPGLRNFPGPFMKFMNDWLTIDDWQRLTAHLEDRRIILRQIVVYQDGRQQKLFHIDVAGVLLRKPQGNHANRAMALVSFDGGKTSAADAINSTGSALLHANRRTSWHILCEWLQRQG